MGDDWSMWAMKAFWTLIGYLLAGVVVVYLAIAVAVLCGVRRD